VLNQGRDAGLVEQVLLDDNRVSVRVCRKQGLDRYELLEAACPA
jgi:hypothetical protein